MLRQKEVKSILNKLKKRDDWFLADYTVNPYEGCSCNCLYCYIRGSKYGENMEQGLAIKSNGLVVLEKQLQRRAQKNEQGFVVVGSATDAYMPHEEQVKLTQGFLQLLLKYRFPVFISTKRNGIIRDIDLLKQIDRTAILPADLQELQRGLILSVSVSTMDEKITAMLEPGALKPSQRMELVKRLKDEGFLVGVNAIPILPFISDTDEELEKIIFTAKQNGANYILAGGLTLFGNEPADSKTLYYEFLQRYRPDLLTEYDKLYMGNFYPPKKYQEVLREKVLKLCAKHDIRNNILNIDVKTT